MGKARGKSVERRLVDMGAPAEPEYCYEPPSKSACQVESYPLELTEVDRLHVRIWSYRGKIVDFAVMQLTVEDGVEYEVARIDCCHGTIHRHQFDRSGNDVLDGRVIRNIPEKNAWDVVDNGYTAAYDALFNDWEANLRRWRR